MWSEQNIISQLCNEAASHPTNGFQLVLPQNNNVGMTPTQMRQSRKHSSGLQAKEVRNHLKVSVTKNKGLVVDYWASKMDVVANKNFRSKLGSSRRIRNVNSDWKLVQQVAVILATELQIHSSSSLSEIISESNQKIYHHGCSSEITFRILGGTGTLVRWAVYKTTSCCGISTLQTLQKQTYWAEIWEGHYDVHIRIRH